MSLEPRAGARQAEGMSEPEPDSVAPDLAAELEAAYARLLVVETQAESLRAEIEATAARECARLTVERDAARTAQAGAEEQARRCAAEQRAAAERADRAEAETRSALARAERAEAIIRRVRTQRGLQGILLRWLASDLLED